MDLAAAARPSPARLTPAGQASRPQAAPGTHPVRQLASESFQTRALAAQALIAEGDRALPALGRAGDMPVRVNGGLQVSATRSVVRAILGQSADEVLIEHLGSPWPNIRREAAAELGQRDRWSAVPRLIDHLEDTDVEVRSASASALRRVTNNFFGYRALASARRRRLSADRWRSWWSQEGSVRAGGPRLGARLEVPPAR